VKKCEGYEMAFSENYYENYSETPLLRPPLRLEKKVVLIVEWSFYRGRKQCKTVNLDIRTLVFLARWS